MVLAEAKLRVGVIYGDPENNEYVYMPGSELGVKEPLCVYEAEGMREDVRHARGFAPHPRAEPKARTPPRLGGELLLKELFF